MLRLTEKLYYQCRISFQKHQLHIQMDNFRLLDDMVPRCYSYHMSFDIPTRMFYSHNLKTGGTIIQYYRTTCLENLTQHPTRFAHNRAICSTT